MSESEQFLALMMPPLELIDRLDAMSNLSESIKAWHKRMADIRGDGKSDIDNVTPEIYQQALFIVEEKIIKVKVY